MEKGAGIRARVCRLSSGERLPLVVDRSGIPIPAPNQWSLTTRRPRVQSNTLIEEMRTLAHVYEWAERRAINLQERLQAGNGLHPGELNALFQNLFYTRPLGRELASRRLQDVSELRTVANSTHGARVTIARDYFVWALEQMLYRLDVGDPRQVGIRERLSLIERQAKDFCKSSPAPSVRRSGLSSEQRAQLLLIVAPLSAINPFHKSVRYRNWALIVLMLTFGLRRGEALKVYVTDVNVRGRTPTIRIVRRPGDPNDSRAIEPAVKTLCREVPLHREMATLLNSYVQHHRTKYPNSEANPFLFLSEEGKPLSLRMVNYVFGQIVRRFPEFDGFLTPHIMRYTYNDMLSEAARLNGLDDAAFKAAQNYLNGWALTSNQGIHYSNRDIEASAAKISLAHQQSLFA